jgi:hypothetical protein
MGLSRFGACGKEALDLVMDAHRPCSSSRSEAFSETVSAERRPILRKKNIIGVELLSLDGRMLSVT